MQFQRNYKKIFGSPLQKYLHNNRLFNVLMQATVYICIYVYISPHNLLFYVDKSILHSLIWLVWLLYSQHFDKMKHLPSSVCWLLGHVGWSAPLPKKAYPELNPDIVFFSTGQMNLFACLFDLILCVPSTIFQLSRDRLPGLNQY